MATSPIQSQVSEQTSDETTATSSMKEQNPAQELESNENLEEDMEEDIVITERWDKVVKAIEAITLESLGASPPFDPSSPSVFQGYWRDVFSGLRQSVTTDQEIPEFLTEPPVKKFSITFMDVNHGMACPCCHREAEPNIILENPSGVTKVDLLNGVIEQLYGAKLPRVYIEPQYLFDVHDRPPRDDVDSDKDEDEEEVDESKSFTEDSGVVVYQTSWISASGEGNGGNLAYSNEPELYFYCCKPERYEDTKKMHDAAISDMNKQYEEARRQRAEAAVEPAQK